MRRSRLVLLMIGIAAVAGLLLLRSAPEGPPGGPAPPGDAASGSGEREPPPPPGGGENRPGDKPSPADPAGDAAAAAPVRWEGTVVVYDHEGIAHPTESGEVRLILPSPGDPPTPDPVPVRGGRFVVESPVGRPTILRSALLGGRAAVPGEVEVLEGDRLRVTARWPRPLVFRVLDAATGAELSGVTILRIDDWWNARDDLPPPPASEEVVVAGAASPVTIPIVREDFENADRLYHVGAEGYAFRAVHVDPSRGGERQVLLGSGGGLDLRVEGRARPGGLWIRLRTAAEAGADPLLELEPGAAEALPLSGVPVGTYRVTAELDGEGAGSRVLAEVRVEIAAGRRASATLLLPELRAPEPAAVSGTLLVPEGWPAKKPRLELELVDGTRGDLICELAPDLEPVPSRTGLHRFEAEGLAPGSWIAEVDGTGSAVAFELAPGERRELRLELPAPAHAEIRFVDTRTGRRAAIHEIRLVREALPGRRCWTVATSDEPGSFDVLLVPGEYEVFVFEDAYSVLSERLTVRPGGASVEFSVSPAYRLAIEFRDGEARVPWPEDWGVPEVEALSGEGDISGMSWEDGKTEVQFDAPGRYRLRFPELEGFRPIPPQEVEIGGAGPQKLVIRLERDR